MASTYLSKTFGTTQTSIYKGTVSFWFKRSKANSGSEEMLFVGYGASNRSFIRFETDDKLRITLNPVTNNIITSQVFRDVSAWYHIVYAIDTTQVTDTNRIKLYVNGTQVTSFSNTGYPTLNYEVDFTNNGTATGIGADGVDATPNTFFNGSMSHFNYIDGTAYDPSAFGETDATTGIWKPKTAPTVTYGTNGFFLKFENSASLGLDSSPNTNNFTVNGTPTQTVDTPSNVFATGNPLQKEPPAFANGNLTYSNGAVWRLATSTLAVSSGKYYAEFKIGSTSTDIGIITTTDLENNTVTYNGQTANSIGMDSSNGNKRINNAGSSYGTASSANDIISVALDLDNNYLYFATNGVWQNSGVPTSGATGTGGIAVTTADLYCFGASQYNTTNHANYGNGYFGTTAVASATTDESGLGIFEYDVPTGYYALCTKNINEQEYS